MQQKNIQTIIEKTDKKLAQQRCSYLIKPHWELLCELAHPNVVGYNRFLTSVNALEGGWTERVMEEKANSEGTIYIATECLWALSFGAGSLDGLFGEFQKLMKISGPASRAHSAVAERAGHNRRTFRDGSG